MKTQTKSYVQDVHAGRIEKMEELEKLTQNPEGEEASEESERVLSVDTQVVKKILLSWGGPECGFKLFFDIDANSRQSPPALILSRGIYYRADWGEYKESDLSDSEAQTVYDFYLGGYAEI